MNKVEVKIDIISQSKSQVDNYVIILSELNSNRKLPLIIKPIDAQYIALKMEKMQAPRPLTKDLFKLMTDAYQIDVQEVHIYNMVEGIYYSRFITSNSIETLNIECTVGDALSMSVLYRCPIYVNEEVMKFNAVEFDGEYVKIEPPSEQDINPIVKKIKTIEDLDKMLSRAISIEDYELAIKLRDKIEKLKIDKE